jgi:hypothetical protein
MCVHRESGAQRAVKVLRKSHMDDDEKRMLFNEINILREIVSFLFASTMWPTRYCVFLCPSTLLKINYKVYEFILIHVCRTTQTL